MLSPIPLKSGKLLAVALVVGVGGFPCLHGQEFTRQLAGADDYFETGIIPSDLLSLLDPTLDGALKGEFRFSISVRATYDSNTNLSRNSGRGSGSDDIIFGVNPRFYYSSDPEGGARHVISAYYSPNPQIYNDNSNRGRFNHNGGFSYSFNGSRLGIGAFLNLHQASEADRFTGGYSEGAALSAGLRANYQLAPRTSINASLSSSYLSYSTVGQRNSDYISTRVGMSWAATELIQIGPSVRYRWVNSDNTGSQNNIALLFNASYRSTELTRISGSIGVESREYARETGGDRSLRLTGGLSFTYAINPIWNWSGGISYANIPSPTAFGYSVNDLSFRTALSRALDYGSLSLSMGYSLSDAQQVGAIVAVPGAAVPGGSDYFNISLRYSRPIGNNGTSFSSRIGYSQSSNWERWTMTAGLSRSF